jgi:hypothetical protein
MPSHPFGRPLRAHPRPHTSSPCTRFLRRVVFAAAASFVAGNADAQTFDPNLWVPNSTVNAQAVFGNTLYVGGSFTRVGPHSGAAVPVGVGTSAPISGFPRIVGAVNAIAPDGAGGWYIGGSFSQIGGVSRTNAARVLGDMTVDPAWNPAPNLTVNAITVSGSTVYLGGQFTTVGGQVRNRIAAVDAASGAVSAWDPNANNFVSTIAVDGSVVYAGGAFTTIGGLPRNRIAALDAVTGAPTAWDPLMTGTSVRSIVASGSLVYVGGAFTTIGGQPRNRLAAIGGDGSLSAWNPDANNTVYALALNPNDGTV